MKTLTSLLTIAAILVAFNVNAKTLEERIANIETKYEQRLDKIDTMRAKDERKEVLRKHAREDADLKIQHLKDLDAIKVARKTK